MKLHFIEKAKKFKQIDKERRIWESGNWVVSKDIASASVGADIYFHREQVKPSYFGGTILSYEKLSDGPDAGRYVFTFSASMEHKNIKTEREGWGMEKKIVK